MPGPYDTTAIMQNPNFLQAIQQLLSGAGPYAGAAAAGLALVPPAAYAFNPGVRQDINQAAVADLGMLGGMAQQGISNYTLPGVIGNLMQARYQPDLGAAPTVTVRPQATAAPTTAPRAQRTGTPRPANRPQATPGPTPPRFPSGPQENVLRAMIAAGAAGAAAPLLYGDVGAAFPAMRQQAVQDVGTVGSAFQSAAQSQNPIVRAYGRPLAGLTSPTATPTAPMAIAPTNTPTSAQTPMPQATFTPGFQREYNGELWTKVEGGWQVQPMPAGGQVRR
jgi:hypothetical protein